MKGYPNPLISMGTIAIPHFLFFIFYKCSRIQKHPMRILHHDRGGGGGDMDDSDIKKHLSVKKDNK